MRVNSAYTVNFNYTKFLKYLQSYVLKRPAQNLIKFLVESSYERWQIDITIS